VSHDPHGVTGREADANTRPTVVATVSVGCHADHDLGLTTASDAVHTEAHVGVGLWKFMHFKYNCDIGYIFCY
jgi:hypothetical protein